MYFCISFPFVFIEDQQAEASIHMHLRGTVNKRGNTMEILHYASQF